MKYNFVLFLIIVFGYCIFTHMKDLTLAKKPLFY